MRTGNEWTITVTTAHGNVALRMEIDPVSRRAVSATVEDEAHMLRQSLTVLATATGTLQAELEPATVCPMCGEVPACELVGEPQHHRAKEAQVEA